MGEALGVGEAQVARIAVDLLDSKLENAKRFGATDTINPSNTDAVKAIKKMTAGGGRAARAGR